MSSEQQETLIQECLASAQQLRCLAADSPDCAVLVAVARRLEAVAGGYVDDSGLQPLARLVGRVIDRVNGERR